MKYALIAEVNQYLHVTLDCYDDAKGRQSADVAGFDANNFIETTKTTLSPLIQFYDGHSAVRNLKTRHEEFSARILHVAVEGEVLDRVHAFLDALPYASSRCVSTYLSQLLCSSLDLMAV